MGWIIVAFIVVFIIAVSSGSKKNNQHNKNYPRITDKDITRSEAKETTFEIHFDSSDRDISEADTFVFDIETTGLPSRRNASPSETEVWPYIVQISWDVFDCDEKVIAGETFLIKQKKAIPYGATQIHGITTQKANSKGKNIKEVLVLLLRDIKYAKTIVAHNIEFDLPILEAELIRNKFDYDFADKRKICTMKSSTDFCALPKARGYGFKYPKLAELVGCLFYNTPYITMPDAHEAHLDMLITAKCYFELAHRNLIREEKMEYERTTTFMSDIEVEFKRREQVIDENKIDGIDAGVDRENLFCNKNILIIGSFINWGNVDYLRKLLTRLGAKFVDSIHDNPDILVCGKNPDLNIVSSFKNLKSENNKLIENENELLSILNGMVLLYIEYDDKFITEYIEIQNNVFHSVHTSGSINYLKYQEFCEKFYEIKDLEKVDVEDSINKYYKLAEEFPQFIGQVYERLEIIYRKLKDYDNEMKICLLDIENRKKEGEKPNVMAISKLQQRYEKSKQLSLKKI